MITSTSNARIKELRRLAKRRERDATRRFLVEGRRELGRAVDAGVELELLVRCPPLLDDADAELVERAGAAEVLDVAPNVLDALVYREGHDGLLGVARMWDTGLDALALPARPLVLVAAGIEKPGNLGAMLRTAAAAGAAALVVADPVVDVFNPNVVRASVGALFAVPVGVAAADAVVAWLRANDVRILATTPDAATPHFAASLDGAAAVVIGREDAGLPATWLEAADERIVVPMPGGRGVDSLNAGSTAAVVLFEAVRQRCAR
ncbi:MAG TPA: TrmH family RNA methyltransferase [Solirubrobacteraceae bacterium]|nr:TrmH family RNA methyltransferase [Solirubrobacteraceae bacterium]